MVDFAIGFEFENANACRESFASVFKLLPVGNGLVVDGVSGTERADIYRLRGGKIFFERRIVLGNGEEFKDPTAGIIEENNSEATAHLPGEEEG